MGIRLFRRHPAVHMKGRIHEQFHPPLEHVAKSEGKSVFPSTIRLRHYGYLSHKLNHKRRRNRDLLSMQLAADSDHLFSLIELGRTLLDLRDPHGHELLARAATQIAAARAAVDPPVVVTPIFLEYLFAFPQSPAASIIPAQVRNELCTRWYPDTPPLLWRLAHEDFSAENFKRCAQILEHLIEIRDRRTFDRTMGFAPFVMGDRILLNLGSCYVRLADLDRAEKYFNQLLNSKECAPEAAQNLKAIANLRDPPSQ